LLDKKSHLCFTVREVVHSSLKSLSSFIRWLLVTGLWSSLKLVVHGFVSISCETNYMFLLLCLPCYFEYTVNSIRTGWASILFDNSITSKRKIFRRLFLYWLVTSHQTGVRSKWCLLIVAVYLHRMVLIMEHFANEWFYTRHLICASPDRSISFQNDFEWYHNCPLVSCNGSSYCLWNRTWISGQLQISCAIDEDDFCFRLKQYA
jgi:hypothetical protein